MRGVIFGVMLTFSFRVDSWLMSDLWLFQDDDEWGCCGNQMSVIFICL